eukprot:scaffold4172_cov212-Alexandrium_tamarense.AAC.15
MSEKGTKVGQFNCPLQTQSILQHLGYELLLYTYCLHRYDLGTIPHYQHPPTSPHSPRPTESRKRASSPHQRRHSCMEGHDGHRKGHGQRGQAHRHRGGGIDIRQIVIDTSEKKNGGASTTSGVPLTHLALQQKKTGKGRSSKAKEQVVLLKRNDDETSKPQHPSQQKDTPSSSNAKVVSTPVLMPKPNHNDKESSKQHKHPQKKSYQTTKAKPVLVLKHNYDEPSKPSQKKTPKLKSQQPEKDVDDIATLKQQLYEIKIELEKERNTQTLVEDNFQRQQSELISLRNKEVEHEKSIEYQEELRSLREEVRFEQELRLSVQNDLAQSNDMISTEQETIKALQRQLETMKDDGNNPIAQELQSTKERLDSETLLRETLQTNLAIASDIISVEKQRNETLQSQLGRESSANIAIRMELQSVKLKLNRTENGAENALKNGQVKQKLSEMETLELSCVRLQLQEAMERLKLADNLERDLASERSKREAAEANVEELTRFMKRSEMIRPSKYSSVEDRDREVEKLRRELFQTKEKLKIESRKYATISQKKGKGGKATSLKDWIDTGLPSSAEVNVHMPRPTQSSLSDAKAETQSSPTHSSKPASATPQITILTRPAIQDGDTHTIPAGSSEQNTLLPPDTTLENIPHPSLPHQFDTELEGAPLRFDGTRNKFCGEDDTNPLHDELAFLLSAYAADEISVKDSKVIHSIQLLIGNNEKYVKIHLTLTIPDGYPSEVLGVDATIDGSSACSHDVRKCVMDALPQLVQICKWEADANKGQEALFSVLMVADTWSQNDWRNIISRKVKTDAPNEEMGGAVEMCTSLVYTHHLVETEKIQMVKKIASKLSLGGYLRVGKPGLVLVEGASEDDCDEMLRELAHCRKVFYSMTFKSHGKTTRRVSDVNSSRLLPHKLSQLEGDKNGMDILKEACEKLGLAEVLENVVE